MLFFGEAGEGIGGAFDGDVVFVEGAEEFGAREGAGGEDVDDLFDFMGDDVAAVEVAEVEDAADEAFGKQVLDEHFVHGFGAEIGVEGFAAEVIEAGEGGFEFGVGVVGEGDFFGEGFADVGDFLFEGFDGGFEVLDGGFGPVEVGVEEGGELAVVAEVDVEGAGAVLDEDGAGGVVVNDVGFGVALGGFGADFGFEVVVGVLGFPIAAVDGEVVTEGGVGFDEGAGGEFVGVFGDELPVAAAGEFGEEGLEGGAGGGFVFDGGVAEFAEGELVIMEDFVGGFELEGHGWGGLGAVYRVLLGGGMVAEEVDDAGGVVAFAGGFADGFGGCGALRGALGARPLTGAADANHVPVRTGGRGPGCGGQGWGFGC